MYGGSTLAEHPVTSLPQLLNHMDGTGPPPMAKENIAGIPTVSLTGDQVLLLLLLLTLMLLLLLLLLLILFMLLLLLLCFCAPLTSPQREKNSSCSVCWEDFTEGEEVGLPLACS